MKFKYLLSIVIVFILTAFFTHKLKYVEKNHASGKEEKYDEPEQFILFHNGIRTREGENQSGYKPGYQITELSKAQTFASQARIKSNGVLEWKERGPANVPGRTRGLAVLPNDATKNTWLAGSSGGGIWKTINGGVTWTNKSENFPTLAVATIAVCENTPNIIYAGTGEYIASSGTAIIGNGILKSTDSGETWSHLGSTANNEDFISVTRIIVDPNNPNIVLACSAPNTWGNFNSTIMRSIDGGTSWTKVFEESQSGAIEQIIATPGNFNIQYASQNGVGVLKSIDAGATWSFANEGMSPSGRLELAVSPANPNRIFASAVGTLSGSGSDLYVSDDAGANWSLINVSFNNAVVDFLGGQGWYDNTIACDPFNADIVYIGGVGIFRLQLGSGSTSIVSYSAQEVGTSFMSLTNFSANVYGGRVRTGASATASVEVRFGPGMTQKAHRFQVPNGATAGVADPDYSYQNYVDVPFEVWKIDENGNDIEQLMASFRDQSQNGVFDLLLSNTTGTAPEQSREYIFISDVPYDEANPSPDMDTNGGHVFNQMYFFWPVLSVGSTWDPQNLPSSEFRILYGSIDKLNATTITVVDVYGDYDSKNRFINFGIDLHPDQHNMVMIPMSGSTYKILASNDGGVFISNTSATPGIAQGNWTMVGKTYNTSQFYGADKRPGFDEYIGGMQDNGTWKSPPNQSATSTTDYLFNIGGDGFEVLWHNLDGTKLIGGSQGNNFRRSLDGGTNWTTATAGLSGTHPFISKLANSKNNPEVIYTVSSAGVFRSANFGGTWSLTPITEKWGASTFLEVDVSRANANVIWAGSGMSDIRNLHVSVDGGQTFSITNNYTAVTLGAISKLATHPIEKNTAYALFSFSKGPKVLRTTDLGQTWEDISGFGTNEVSSTNFPDVAVYCLYVRPDNPDIIWVGTEIGIVESQDNGATWALLTDFPNVSVWDMKGQDDQVVIATHGRGIWTATIEAPQVAVKTPEIIASGTSPKKELKLRLSNEGEFDSVQFLVGNQLVKTIENPTIGNLDVALPGVSAGTKSIKLIGYSDGAPFHSKTYSVEKLNIISVENSYSTYFTNLTDLKLSGLTMQNFTGAEASERKSLQTPHPYAANRVYSATLLKAVKINNSNPVLHYADIAIAQPVNDTVVVEATKNGLDWFTLTSYDVTSNPQWQTAFNASQLGNASMFDNKEIDLSDRFDVGDSIIVRFSFYSNPTVTGWGWAMSYLTIQQEPTATENPLLAENKMNVFPNPSNGNFTVEYELIKPSQVQIEIVDVFGKKIITKDVGLKSRGLFKEPVYLQNVMRGNYIVIVKTNSGNKISKISVSK